MTTPASSCMQCRTNATISTDQHAYNAHGDRHNNLINRTRFHCPKCHRVWICDTPDATEHGAFLDRAHLQ